MELSNTRVDGFGGLVLQIDVDPLRLDAHIGSLRKAMRPRQLIKDHVLPQLVMEFGVKKTAMRNTLHCVNFAVKMFSSALILVIEEHKNLCRHVCGLDLSFMYITLLQ